MESTLAIDAIVTTTVSKFLYFNLTCMTSQYSLVCGVFTFSDEIASKVVLVITYTFRKIFQAMFDLDMKSV